MTSKFDILIDVDISNYGPIIWHYFRGCPEIKVHIRPYGDAVVIVEHMQKDSRGDWSTECDGPELYIEDNTLYDMVYAGVVASLVGKGYAGAEAIYVDDLPESSKEFIINDLHLGEYVTRC